MANDEHLHKAFAFFDKNQSGFIEMEELRAVLSEEQEPNSEDVISAIMQDVDADKVSIAVVFRNSSYSLFVVTYTNSMYVGMLHSSSS